MFYLNKYINKKKILHEFNKHCIDNIVVAEHLPFLAEMFHKCYQMFSPHPIGIWLQNRAYPEELRVHQHLQQRALPKFHKWATS